MKAELYSVCGAMTETKTVCHDSDSGHSMAESWQEASVEERQMQRSFCQFANLSPEFGALNRIKCVDDWQRCLKSSF